MTPAQIHSIIYMHGLMKGIDCLSTVGSMPHRTKEFEAGRTVGIDEIKYRTGGKYLSKRVKSIYESVVIKGEY